MVLASIILVQNLFGFGQHHFWTGFGPGQHHFWTGSGFGPHDFLTGFGFDQHRLWIGFGLGRHLLWADMVLDCIVCGPILAVDCGGVKSPQAQGEGTGGCNVGELGPDAAMLNFRERRASSSHETSRPAVF